MNKYDIDDDNSFLVDVNGIKKGKGALGEDVFRFFIQGRKVVYIGAPDGCVDDACSACINNRYVALK